MWLPDQIAHQIDAAMKDRKFRQVDSILDGIFKNGAMKKETAQECPVCAGGLVHKPLPYLEIFVRACPGGHGAWMNSKACAELCELISQHAVENTRKRYVLLGLLIAGSILGTINLAVNGRMPGLSGSGVSSSTVQADKIGYEYWPMRDTTRYALPLRETKISNIEDLYYLKLLTDQLDIVLSNRMNMDAVLESKRDAQEYRDLYAVYHGRQSEAAEALSLFDVPEKFRAAHRKIVEAVKLQIGFYAYYAEEKARNPAASLADFSNHPALAGSSRDLQEAWEEIRSLYPGMDEKTRLAIESRLCWSDIN